MHNDRSDAAWAWACAIFAAIVSVAVNIGHAEPQGYGYVAFSASLPIMLLGAVELMVRKLLGRTIVGLIGVSAYALSFWHTVLLLRSWGEPIGLAFAGSVAVDGLMVGSTVALYNRRKKDLAGRESDDSQRAEMAAKWAELKKAQAEMAVKVEVTALDTPTMPEPISPEPTRPEPVKAIEAPKPKVIEAKRDDSDGVDWETIAQEHQDRFGTDDPMTAKDLMDRFGVTRSAADGRVWRWNKRVSKQVD